MCVFSSICLKKQWGENSKLVILKARDESEEQEWRKDIFEYTLFYRFHFECLKMFLFTVD